MLRLIGRKMKSKEKFLNSVAKLFAVIAGLALILFFTVKQNEFETKELEKSLKTSYKEECINGVLYYKKTEGTKGYMAVKYNKETKDIVLCSN